jgi:sirohydrochlorin cobaltochelatase
MQAARPGVSVQLAFQEFMTPTLEAAVAQSVAEGARRVMLVPLFIGPGSHVKRDLPLFVQQERQRHPQLELQVLPAIGDAPEILQAITDWILRADASGAAR